jgi:hypothetical protein
MLGQGVEARLMAIDSLRSVKEQERGALAASPDIELAATDIDGGVLSHWAAPWDSGGRWSRFVADN